MEPESIVEEQSSLEHSKDMVEEGLELFWKQMNSLKSMMSVREALVLVLLILLGGGFLTTPRIDIFQWSLSTRALAGIVRGENWRR